MAERLKLNTVIPQGIVYTPGEFVPQEFPNVDILAKSFALNEAREKEATEKQSAIDAALGKIEQELNPAELDWFSNYKQNVKDNINQFVQAGDYSGAFDSAVSWAGKMQSDTELTARLKNSAEYNAKMQELDAMVDKQIINNATANYIKKQNPYNNKIIYKDGVAIGSDKWDFNKKPVADLNINTFFEDVFKSIHPDARAVQNTTNMQYGVPSKKTGQAAYARPDGNFVVPSAITEAHASSKKKVDPKEILSQAYEMLIANPDWSQQLEQLYGGAWQTYQDNLEKMSTLDKDSQEYKSLKFITDKQKQYFYTGKVENPRNQNTFENYFNKLLFESDQAKAYGYTIEDYENSYMFHGTTDNKSKEEEELWAKFFGSQGNTTTKQQESIKTPTPLNF